jgi:hypothetical protein
MYGGATASENTAATVISANGVQNKDICRRAGLDVDTVVAEAEDHAMFYVKHPAAQEVDSVDSRTCWYCPIDRKIAQGYDIACASADCYPVRTGNQNGSNLPFAAVNRNRLRDSDRAEAARIQGINLAPSGRFRNSASEGLARRGSAAGVGVITYS